MRSSYLEEDVTLLLKDITGMVQPQPTEERERLIQAGKHYCEMLPIEYVPSSKYMEVYREALRNYAAPTARAVTVLADKVIEEKGKDVVLVSLARAGVPIGILLKRYIRYQYGIETDHYGISIIRGRGIDKNAMNYLLERYAPERLLFVDGWIGKGAILNELRKDLEEFTGVAADIAVLADPANVTELCGTHEDILIPSSCLNCTVSGLISRTFLRDDIIGEKDFHGAVYYGELADEDLSYAFIHAIENEFKKELKKEFKKEFENERESCSGSQKGAGKENGKEKETAAKEPPDGCGIEEVREIAEKFGIDDINLVKPGIGETTRVLLRRVPWKVLIDKDHEKDAALAHIVRLAEEKNVPVESYPLRHYRACGIIKKMADS